MSATSLTIREATAADADFIAWVQVEASRSNTPLGFWDLALPGPDARRLELVAGVVADAGKPSFAHFGGFLVAELDGVSAGALSGYDPTLKKLGHFVGALDRVLAEDGWNQAHRELVWKRVMPMVACMSDTPDDRFVVEWVALEPQARGKGVAASLLDAVLQRGRDAGFRRAQISHLIGNTAAERCYQRAGFRTVDDKRHPDFEAIFGVPGSARMWMDL
jgi:translation initiation factor 4G